MLKGDFRLVDGLEPAETPVAIGGSSSAAAGTAEAEPAGGDEAGAGEGERGERRKLDESAGEDEAEALWTAVPERRSLLLPFGKTARGGRAGEVVEDDRVQIVVGVALEVRDGFFGQCFCSRRGRCSG